MRSALAQKKYKRNWKTKTYPKLRIIAFKILAIKIKHSAQTQHLFVVVFFFPLFTCEAI